MLQGRSTATDLKTVRTTRAGREVGIVTCCHSASQARGGQGETPTTPAAAVAEFQHGADSQLTGLQTTKNMPSLGINQLTQH